MLLLHHQTCIWVGDFEVAITGGFWPANGAIAATGYASFQLFISSKKISYCLIIDLNQYVAWKYISNKSWGIFHHDINNSASISFVSCSLFWCEVNILNSNSVFFSWSHKKYSRLITSVLLPCNWYNSSPVGSRCSSCCPVITRTIPIIAIHIPIWSPVINGSLIVW